jgi:hypothetical protein
MANPYDFIITSDDQHEKVFIEIYYEGKFVAQISQERGQDNLEIEFPGIDLVESLIARNVPLNTFLSLVREASEKLIQ